MALPTFPEELVLISSGYSVNYDPQLRRTQFENGSLRQTPTASVVIVERNVEYIACDFECYEKFRNFVRNELALGSGWFMWDALERGNAGKQSLLRARIKEGQYKSTPESNDFMSWKINFTIEVMELT